jgi:nucleoside-diphosphate-sugar epimerase
VFGGEDYTEKKNTVVAKLLKGTFKLEGDGTQTRDFIHVEDVCKAMTEIMKEPSGIYEIRSGVQISINELVEIYDMEGDEGLEEALWDGYGHGKNTRHWSKLV